MKKRLYYLSQLIVIFTIILLFLGCRKVEEEEALSLAYLTITPETSSMLIGESVQLKVAGTYTDVTSRDFSDSATWKSANESVAAFSSETQGLLSAVGAGTAEISSVFGGASATFSLTVVSLISIQITPTDYSLPLGLTKQYSAIGTYSDDSTRDITNTVNWSSDETAVVLVDDTSNGKGLVRGLAVGTAAIKATLESVSATTDISVTTVTVQSIEIAPLAQSIAAGTSQNLVATGVFSDSTILDITDSVSWLSSDISVVTLDRSSGSSSVQANGVTVGSATISARYGDVVGSSVMTVNSGTLETFIINPASLSLPRGGRDFLKAIAIFDNNTYQDISESVTWTSSDSSTVTVSSVNKGTVDALMVGTATISALTNLGSGPTATIAVTVTSAELSSVEIFPLQLNLANNTNQKFFATGIYSDNTSLDLTEQVTWGSSDDEILLVGNEKRNKGMAQALKTGKVYLSAILTGIAEKGASTALTVSDPILSTIQVNPKNTKFAVNLKKQFSAVGIFSDNYIQDLTDSVIWSSSVESALKINNAEQDKGSATSLTAGTTVVTASLGSISGSTTVTISSATLGSIEITPTNSYLAAGQKRSFKATGIYSDNSSFDLTSYVTWNTDGYNKAVVSNAGDNKGEAINISEGSTIVSAYYGNIKGSTILATSTATLSLLQVTPENPACIPGAKLNFTATGIFSDNTTQDLTKYVVWKTSDILVADISNSRVNRGMVDCYNQGSSTITAAMGTRSGTTNLTVLSIGAGLNTKYQMP